MLLRRTICIAVAAALPASADVLNVRDFGAVGDGKTKDTAALQKAIDRAGEIGGGTVLLPAGTWLSGSLRLRSRVTLHLEAGATLLGSTDAADFETIVPRVPTLTTEYASQSLLYGEDLQDVAIVGRGTIDGQGGNPIYNPKMKNGVRRRRPFNIRIVSSRNIRLEGITLRDSPMWMQHYLACENVLISGITVDNRSNNNNDGLDIDSCKDVRVSDCRIQCIDDAICLKSTAERMCENVVVTNCVTTNHTNGVKMGTEALAGFRNVTVSNCAMYDCGMAAISLSIVDGGTLDGVTVTNLALHEVDTPLFLRLGNRGRTLPGRAAPAVGKLRNVMISNIVAVECDAVGSSIHGLPGHPVENVSLSNLRLTYRGGGTREDADRVLPELESDYPEHSMFGRMPAYGFYCRHVDGLTLDNVQVGWHKPDARPAVRCEDVRNLRINGLRAMPGPQDVPTVVLQDADGALLTGCTALPGTGAWLSLVGKLDRISVLANDLSLAGMPFHGLSAVPSGVFFEAGNRLPR